MEIAIQKTVNPNLRVDMAMAVGWVKARWQDEEFGEFVITSIKDGEHGVNSQHKQNQPPEVLGEAVDIRTRHLFHKSTKMHIARFVDFCRMLQREGFRVVLHPDWTPERPDGPAHLHLGAPRTFFIEGAD